MRTARGLFLIILIVFPFSTSGQETCCWRHVRTYVASPSGPLARKVRFAWDSVFTKREFGGGPLLDDCPLKIDVGGPKVDIDYVFNVNLALMDVSNQFVLNAQLFDKHHGHGIKSGQISWIDPGDDITATEELQKHTRDLARTFQPLDDILFEYEKMPQRCDVEPEKDEVEAGEKIVIHLKRIEESKGNPPQSFQKILVKAKEGKVLNGTPQGEDYRMFEAASEIDVDYSAPDECREQTETFEVFNSCNIDPNVVSYIPDREIADKNFKIVCNQWEGTIESTWEVKSKGEESLIAALLHEGEFRASENWRLHVVFRKDRGNERIKVYKIQSARIEYEAETGGKSTLEDEGVKIEFGEIKDRAKIRRALRSSECLLELIIDMERKKYRVEGLLDILNVPIESDSEFKIDARKVIQHNETESETDTEDIQCEIEFEGEFSEDTSERFEGSQNQMDKLQPDAKEFIEALAGKMSDAVKWNLRKRKHE